VKKGIVGSAFRHGGLYLFLGVACGVLGTLFSKGVSYVTEIRLAKPYLLFFLPLAGLASVFLCRSLKVDGMGTNQVIKSTGRQNVLSPNLAPAVFFSSLLSHLCGASVGREGAALQLGGSSAVLLAKGFRVSRKTEKVLIYCGMAGVFSSVFGTPFAAAVFALEVVFVGHLYYHAIGPVWITSFVSFGTARLLGAHAERFALTEVPDGSISVLRNVILLSFATVLLGIVFCHALEFSEKLFEKRCKNPFLRIAVGGAAIVLLTVLAGTYDYNGAGIHVIERIFHSGEVAPGAFLWKLLFTCLAVGAGFKGGEIVPTLFIGAAFGALVGTRLGLPAACSAAISMIALFCGVTNCPLASVLLAAELFSGKGIGYILPSVVISYCLSGRISLYTAQKTSGFKNLF